MSNAIVGTVYAQIMEKVISASQNDFEEGGVDQQTLTELREMWQTKLSNQHVAHFPWEPTPAQPQIVNPPTVPSNAKPDPSPVSSATAQSVPNGNYGGARIKTEPGYESGPQMPPYQQPNGYNSGLNPQLAQQRAMNILQQNYGAQAAENIAASQQQRVQANQNSTGGLVLPGQQQSRPVGLQLPGQGGQQQRQGQPQNYQHQYNSQQQRPSTLANAQTDGAGDEWAKIVAQRKTQTDEDRLAADMSLRERLQQMSEQMDSGLMVPLTERCKSKGRGRRIRVTLAGPSSVQTNLASIPQLDGELGLDDERDDDDEDAINSDLDDSEDEVGQQDDDEGEMGETMLCTYDKVQRVKNKWKCTLKDGILTTNNKEYLFHKAQGEFEW
ncbi:transcription factor IIA, alpha/beta subunit [Patellaria atrata CBS 101060]|uniref:Transcription factor IIA, alpha/beta subunit n=1 Tax=Patellaria atrata CBS 101060 TaxID=1346257 RepID=A0A9P4VQ48_9PEZI|nr:transcription factor IIA, alpha/beta subunit [Patellaria atrata CBS 101060]